MVKTIELQLEQRVLDRVRQLARARHCQIEDVFADAIERMPPVVEGRAGADRRSVAVGDGSARKHPLRSGV